MICDDCKNKEQIKSEDFNKLPFELARQLDCKNILLDGNQCSSYSIEEIKDKEEIIKISKILKGGKKKNAKIRRSNGKYKQCFK